LKIAILEMRADDPTATGARGRAMVDFLRQRGHHVEVLAPAPATVSEFARLRFSLWSRVKRRALRRRALPHLWDHLADELEPRIRAGRYDVLIGRLQPVAYVLTRRVGPRAVFDMANVGFLESYHSAEVDLGALEADYEKEMEIYRAVDAILSPHPLLSSFFRANVWDTPKLLDVLLGCDAPTARARFSVEPRIVYAGSYASIQDPYLLALLSREARTPIHCYGPRDPNRAFLPAPLDYRGYAPSLDVLAEYQLGLITVSQDRLRQNSPATKFAYYFSYGLPVLFPSWMKEGHEYPAAVPYDERTFDDVVRGAVSDQAHWERLSAAALETAAGRRWNDVLQPLGALCDRWAAEDESSPSPVIP
jgi:hypothetical protein